MALRLVCDGIAWPLAQQTKPGKLQQEIVIAIKQKDPLTVALADQALLILNGEQLAHAVIFDAGPEEAPEPINWEDGGMHVRPVTPGGMHVGPVTPGGDDAGLPPGPS